MLDQRHMLNRQAGEKFLFLRPESAACHCSDVVGTEHFRAGRLSVTRGSSGVEGRSAV